MYGPCHIIYSTGHGSYYAKKLHETNSHENNCMTHNLYQIPLTLKKCEPVDTLVTRYIKKTHALIDNPLNKY